MRKVNASGTTNYYRDGDVVMLETDANSSSLGRYTYCPNGKGPLISLKRDFPQYYVYDPLGTTRNFIYDYSGAHVVEQYTYKAFGEELGYAGASNNPYRFNGRHGYQRDISDRMYVGARHFDAIKARWLSADPIGVAGGDANLYRYVGNSPLDRIDPTGLSSQGSGGDMLAAILDGSASAAPSYTEIQSAVDRVFGVHLAPNYRATSSGQAGGAPQPRVGAKTSVRPTRAHPSAGPHSAANRAASGLGAAGAHADTQSPGARHGSALATMLAGIQRKAATLQWCGTALTGLNTDPAFVRELAPLHRKGVTLNGQRYYDASVGRFVTRDPIGYDGGINLHAFRGNDAVMDADPTETELVLGPKDHPWLVFTSADTKKGLQTGLAVAADTYSFGLYSSRAYKNQPGYEGAAFLASVSREVALQAAGVGAAQWLARARAARAASAGVAAATARRGATVAANRLFSEKAVAGLQAQLGGGETNVGHATSLGTRFVDLLHQGVAHEVKTGRISSSAFVRREIGKDAELLARGKVQDVVWHFYTGRLGGKGASAAVTGLLNNAGITIVIH